MRAFPNDDSWRALFDAADVIAPTAAIGITRRIDTTSLSIVYKYAHGVTGYLPAPNEAPDAFDPETRGRSEAQVASVG